MRRLVGALLVALAALALGAPSAAAHGGTLLLDRTVGAYTVVLHGRALPGTDSVDYTVTLWRDRRPDDAAEVTLQVRPRGGAWSREYRAGRAANTYEVVLSQPSRDAWRGWDVRIAIDGPGGPATTTYEAGADGPDEGSPAPTAAIVGSLAALALASGAAIVAVRRRRR